jgi:hypothetical protein
MNPVDASTMPTCTSAPSACVRPTVSRHGSVPPARAQLRVLERDRLLLELELDELLSYAPRSDGRRHVPAADWVTEVCDAPPSLAPDNLAFVGFDLTDSATSSSPEHAARLEEIKRRRAALIAITRQIRALIRALFWTTIQRPPDIISRQIPWFLTHGTHPPHLGMCFTVPGR